MLKMIKKMRRVKMKTMMRIRSSTDNLVGNRSFLV